MTTGIVKFFNPAKGFGFIAPEDGGTDVFVHVSAVERSGLPGLNEGDQVSFEVEADRRSGKLAAVDLELISAGGGPTPRARSARPSGGFERQNRSGGFTGAGRAGSGGSGVVKWFNSQKGFGFIQPHDGGGDVFVHISAVERSGLSALRDGQAVSYDLQEDRRTGKLTATNLRAE